MANLTIAIDDEVLKCARLRATEQATSVNRVVHDNLEQFAGSPAKQRRARELLARHARVGETLLSTQVLQELHVAVTRFRSSRSR